LIDRGVGEDPTHTAIRKIHPVAVPFPVGALAGFPASCLSAARCVLAGPFSRWDLVEARGLRPTAREQRCAWRHPKPQTRAVRRIIQQRDDRWRFLDRSPPRDGATYRALRTGLEPSCRTRMAWQCALTSLHARSAKRSHACRLLRQTLARSTVLRRPSLCRSALLDVHAVSQARRVL